MLRTYEPRHVLLRATRADAARGLADLGRLAAMLARVRTRIVVRRLAKVSPLAVPVLLEIGKESVHGEGIDELLDLAARDLIAEVTGDIPSEGARGAAGTIGMLARRSA